ncbi:hypothetical protein [Clostridium senegalense]|uniref:hypothetical protein n=1 Tax=Clostridium senegalense TaxID=1465809 RepID=UPI0002881A53|nr:hypothetical protein [Clostridium senegalense]
MSKEIDELKSIAGDYKIWALKSRKRFIDLRFQQDLEIREIYIRLTNNISKQLKKEGLSPFNKKRLEQMYLVLSQSEWILKKKLINNFKKYSEANIEAATGYSKAILINGIEKTGVKKIEKPIIEKMYFRTNEKAVEAIWNRTKEGLYLSDNIWSKAEKYRNTMTTIIQGAVAEGQDCVKTARMLDQYVLKGKKTLVDDYPNMIKRIGNRVPSDISYESLRLARTKMTAAYGEGTLISASVNPAAKGIKYILSNTHPKPDMCDAICGVDDYGLGSGVYPVENAPSYPFHPNCLCTVITVTEKPKDFVQRLKRWQANPMSEPSLESWYQNVYKKYIT